MVVEAVGDAFILEAKIQGLSAWYWPWIRRMSLFIDTLIMKVKRKDDRVNFLLLLSSCSYVQL